MAVLIGRNGKAQFVVSVFALILSLFLSRPASAQSMSCSPSSVTGGLTSTGTISIPSPAPPGGSLFHLISGNTDYATVPATVTIPQGSLSQNFTITTKVWYSPAGQPAQHMAVTIYTTESPTTSTVIDVLSTPGSGPTLSSITVNPSSVVGRNSSTVTATLTGAAGPGGVWVSLSSSNPTHAAVPSTVYVPAGSSTSQPGTVNTYMLTAPPSSITVTITGTLDSTTRTASLTILASSSACGISASISVSPNPVLKSPSVQPYIMTLISASVNNPNNLTLDYSWNFGDNTTGTGSSNWKAFTQLNLVNGVIAPYHVTLTVTDHNNPACNATASTDVIVYAGVGRKNSPGYGGSCDPDVFTGNAMIDIEDPVPTRGWPLVNNIYLNTQYVESNRLLKNATFTYDIHITTETNYDDGWEHWILVDGTGRRLDFGITTNAPTPEPGVFSQLIHNPNDTWVLQNAGPPESIDTAGNFRYDFNSSKQLTTITDPAGNTQTLTYANGSLSQITDTNTGRYIEVSPGSSVAFIHHAGIYAGATTQVFFSAGKVSSVTLNGSGASTVTSWQFTYDGSNLIKTWTRDNNAASKVTYNYTAFPHAWHDSTPNLPLVMLANRSTSEGQTRYIWGYDPVSPAADSVFVTNNKGGTFRYDFNSLGDVTKVTTPVLAGATQASLYTFGYNGQRQVSSVSDGTTPSIWSIRATGCRHQSRRSAAPGRGHTNKTTQRI